MLNHVILMFNISARQTQGKKMEDFVFEYYYIAEVILLQYPAWRIFKRVGLCPWFSLTVLVPGLGIIICALILALTKWQNQPALE